MMLEPERFAEETPTIDDVRALVGMIPDGWSHLFSLSGLAPWMARNADGNYIEDGRRQLEYVELCHLAGCCLRFLMARWTDRGDYGSITPIEDGAATYAICAHTKDGGPPRYRVENSNELSAPFAAAIAECRPGLWTEL
jgi:hypothetical protein